MSAPIDLLLSRLPEARPSGPDRWRCACPVCGERSRSTLSIGVAGSGAVLLKCWKTGCDPEQIARAIGLDVADLFAHPSVPAGGASAERRRRMMSDRQALEILANESLLTWTAAHNLAHGHALTDADLERLDVAARRIQNIAAEARA